MIGAAALDVLTSKQALACSPPGQCYGYPSCACIGLGCSPNPTGGCCWVYTDPVLCRTYKCCDITWAGSCHCICLYLVCRCC
jgi:hypothetical protein